MTKEELVSLVAETRGMKLTKKETGEVCDLFVEAIKRAILRDRRLVITGFGTFSMRVRRARMGVNPQTKALIRIPAQRTVGFKPAPSFKRKL